MLAQSGWAFKRRGRVFGLHANEHGEERALGSGEHGRERWRHRHVEQCICITQVSSRLGDNYQLQYGELSTWGLLCTMVEENWDGGQERMEGSPSLMGAVACVWFAEGMFVARGVGSWAGSGVSGVPARVSRQMATSLCGSSPHTRAELAP